MLKSALISRLQEKGDGELGKLVTHALARKGEQVAARDAIFEAKMKKWERIAASDFSHRLAADPNLNGTVFDASDNSSVQMVRNIGRFILARCWKDLFASNPWFAVLLKGAHDPGLAGNIIKHAGGKLDEAKWPDKAREAMKTTLDLGWVPVKTTWRTEEECHEELATVLCDKKGKPIVAPDGEYIYPEDPTSADGAEEEGESALSDTNAEEFAEMAPGAGADPDMAEETQEPAGPEEMDAPQTFLRAPGVELPTKKNGLQWKETAIENRQVIWDGLDFQSCHWRDVAWDFLAPECNLTYCDQISHTRDLTLNQLRAIYDPDGDNTFVQDALERIKSGDTAPKAEANQPKPERQEIAENKTDPENPTIKVTEFYRRHQVMEKGPESRVFLCVAEGQDVLIWADYLAAITPEAEAPIHIVAVNRVSGRAYGIGIYELYEMASEIVDKLTNSIILRNDYAKDPIKLIDKRALTAVDGKPEGVLKVGPGNWITVDAKSVPIQDLVHVLALPDLNQRSWDLMEMFRQLIQVESGVTNANQGDMTDLPSNNTATGVNSMMESSSVLHQYTLAEFKSGLTPPLRLAIRLLYFKQTDDEAYEYLEGQPSGTLTLAQAQQLKSIQLKVEILLSRAKRQELREAAMAAIPVADAYYQGLMGIPGLEQQAREWWATKTLALRTQAFRGMDIDNSDTFFPSPAELQTVMAQAAAAAQAQQAALAAQQAGMGTEPQEGQPSEEQGAQEESDAVPFPAPQSLPDNVIPDAA